VIGIPSSTRDRSDGSLEVKGERWSEVTNDVHDVPQPLPFDRRVLGRDNRTALVLSELGMEFRAGNGILHSYCLFGHRSESGR